ncbi:MAG: NAD(P)H-hydrate dehydratase [Nannocystaceae bacterium]
MPRYRGGLWRAAKAAHSDRHTMDVCGVPSWILMERAGLAVAHEVFQVLRDSPQIRGVWVLCGPGNNGGDGVAVARQLHGWGVEVTVVLVTPKHNETLARQLRIAEACGVSIRTTLPEHLGPECLIVDAMLGTGSRGAPRGGVADALVWAERCLGEGPVHKGPVVVAVDLPSGVEPDTGHVHAHALKADVTVTFEHSKPGLHVTPGRAWSGRVVVAAIGLRDPGPSPEDAPELRLIDPQNVEQWVASSHQAAHKGQRGHVGIVGGSAGTPGAAVLAGVAALRGGAGLATVCSSQPEVAQQLLATRPELMVATPALEPKMLPAATALVVGPGLTDPKAQSGLEALYCEDPRPAVWDASALDSVVKGAQAPRVLTPHPGEAARMLTRLTGRAWTSKDVQARRLEAAATLARETEVVVVLKGAGTIVATREWMAVAVSGGPALATAGSGDCLAGLIAALLARGLKPSEAAQSGVHIHGVAGELAAQARPGAVALDIADCIGPAMVAQDRHPRWPRYRLG